MFSVIYNINLFFVIIAENMSEETCTHQADNSKPVKCCVVCCFMLIIIYTLMLIRFCIYVINYF